MLIDMIQPEIQLSFAYAPARCRAALSALFALDDRLGQIVRTTREPMIGEMRLVWWRDQLTSLASGGAPSGEPILGALHATGIDGTQAAVMTEGWAALLGPQWPDAAMLERYAAQRGAPLFSLAAMVLGEQASICAAAGGSLWSLVDFARHCSDRETAALALGLARRQSIAMNGMAWPRVLRPIGMLVVLAQRDCRYDAGNLPRAGAPGRIAQMIWHRLTGR